LPDNKRSKDLDFAADLFKAADKLRGNREPSEYKHVALGLIFLKYISDAFDALHEKLSEDEWADPEEPDEYAAEHVFWVPKEAPRSYLQANAKRWLCCTNVFKGGLPLTPDTFILWVQ
jgi:type I restriction enzyme M protein